MEDKEIIINDVDVARCGYFCEADNECSICGMGTDGEDTFCKNCKDNPNCYYKQLKRLEQENARKKDMIERQWKLLEQCGVHAGGELRRVSYLLEKLRKENETLRTKTFGLDSKLTSMCEQNKELTEDNLNLSKENERLKEEVKLFQYAHDNEQDRRRRFEDCLQEIKDYLNTLSGIDNDFVNTETYLRVLDCITKAESEEQ